MYSSMPSDEHAYSPIGETATLELFGVKRYGQGQVRLCLAAIHTVTHSVQSFIRFDQTKDRKVGLGWGVGLCVIFHVVDT